MSDIYSTNPRTLGRAICIITGASKGFGRVLAHEVSLQLVEKNSIKKDKQTNILLTIQVSPLLKPGSVLLLVARSEALLQELQEELRSFTEEQQLVVHCIAVDLSTREGVDEAVRVAKQEAVNEMDHVLLINNAGES